MIIVRPVLSETVNLPGDGNVKPKLSVGVRTGDTSFASGALSWWSTVSRLTQLMEPPAAIVTALGVKDERPISICGAFGVAANEGAAKASAASAAIATVIPRK